jgi:CPA1 family monovalent cation:H+ antiporter
MPLCDHLAAVTTADYHRPPNTPQGCEECLKLGDRWVHLRMCLACGLVGCCDSSKNRHATGHFQTTAHPTIRSIERGERWMWCYVDESGVDARF